MVQIKFLRASFKRGEAFTKRQNCHHTETSQLIWFVNQVTAFYMMTTLAFNELLLMILGVLARIDFRALFLIYLKGITSIN